MPIKLIAREQYRNKMNHAADCFRQFLPQHTSWIQIARQALGMSSAQLSRRLGVSRVLVSKFESAEKSGGITIKKMSELAEGMNCRFVYAIIPEETAEDLIQEQARLYAQKIIDQASSQMALEDQSLSRKELEKELHRLVEELVRNPPRDFWEPDQG